MKQNSKNVLIGPLRIERRVVDYETSMTVDA